MSPWASDPSSKRRDRLYIVAEILEVARKGTLKSQIMYGVNLSFVKLNDYLGFITESELLAVMSQGKKDVYTTTEKGVAFLQRYREISELIRDEDRSTKNDVKVPPEHLLKRSSMP